MMTTVGPIGAPLRDANSPRPENSLQPGLAVSLSANRDLCYQSVRPGSHTAIGFPKLRGTR